MPTERPNGSYAGPLSLEWCAYSSTVRAMPMNYMAADLSRIDAALWGREPEIGAMLAEAPAMVDVLRKVVASPMAAPWLERDGGTISAISVILARIDAATPTA